MKEYIIYPLDMGTLIRSKAQVTGVSGAQGTIEIPILAYYVTDGERKILVDSGGTKPDGVRYQPHSQSEKQTARAQLAQFGVTPEEIDTVILTHLHWDHAGGNLDFPNAKFYTQEKELHYAIAPLPIHQYAYDIKLIVQTNYEILYGDTELFDGISVMLTPGHSNGFQSVVVNTRAGKYLIVSDLINLYQCWEANPPIINGCHVCNEDYFYSFRRVKQSGCIILPGHEPSVLQKTCFPQL